MTHPWGGGGYDGVTWEPKKIPLCMPVPLGNLSTQWNWLEFISIAPTQPFVCDESGKGSLLFASLPGRLWSGSCNGLAPRGGGDKVEGMVYHRSSTSQAWVRRKVRDGCTPVVGEKHRLPLRRGGGGYDSGHEGGGVHVHRHGHPDRCVVVPATPTWGILLS